MTLEAAGQDTADTTLTAITSSASANTKGSWVELVASTGQACERMKIDIRSTTDDETFLIDIGVGAAASESVVISNIQMWTNGPRSATFTLPITIASGSRISARCQDSSGSGTIDIAITYNEDDSYGTSASNITIGSDTANSLGTEVDPGGTANTKGSWTELAASTSADIDYLVVMIHNTDNNNIGAVYRVFVDIGTGAAASETVLVPNMYYTHENFEYGFCSFHAIRETINSGTRVSVRAQSDGTDSTDRLVSVSIIGCNMTAPSGGGGGGNSNLLAGKL